MNFPKDSIQISFEDLEGWLAGTDNGRAGCGAARELPAHLGFPLLSIPAATARSRFLKNCSQGNGRAEGQPVPALDAVLRSGRPDHRYPIVTLPPSDWYVGTGISQSIEGHNTAYHSGPGRFLYTEGYLMNLYGHSGSTSGDHADLRGLRRRQAGHVGHQCSRVVRLVGKTGRCRCNSQLYRNGETAITSATISGATDEQTAIEVVIPNWSSGAISNVVVMLNGVPADPSQYRSTNYGVKVLVGTTITNVTVSYAPLEGWVQTDWVGGAGQSTWSDPTRYESSTNINDDVAGQFSLNLAAAGRRCFLTISTALPRPDSNPVPFYLDYIWDIRKLRCVSTLLAEHSIPRLSSASQYGFAYN